MRFRYIVTAAALGYIAWALTDHSIWSDVAALEALWHPTSVALRRPRRRTAAQHWLETAKWHALTATGDKPWTASLREVLVGATFAMVTPNRTGDAVARVALLPANERPLGTQAWLLSAWAQAGWTLTIGTAAWWACTAAGQIGLPIPAGASGRYSRDLLPRAQFGGSCPASPALRGASIGGWKPVGASSRAGGHRATPRSNRPERIALCRIRHQFAAALAAWGIEWDLRSTPPSPWFTLGT